MVVIQVEIQHPLLLFMQVAKLSPISAHPRVKVLIINIEKTSLIQSALIMNRQPSQQPQTSRQQSRQTPNRDRPFVASRIPLGGENTPYSRPVPRGTQPPPPAQRSGTSSQGSERVLETCLQLLKEIRQGIEEHTKKRCY